MLVSVLASQARVTASLRVARAMSAPTAIRNALAPRTRNSSLFTARDMDTMPKRQKLKHCQDSEHSDDLFRKMQVSKCSALKELVPNRLRFCRNLARQRMCDVSEKLTLKFRAVADALFQE